MVRMHNGLTAFALLVTLVALLASAQPVGALNIIIDYQDMGNEPAADPGGQKIQVLAAHVAQYYEDIIQTPHTYTVHLRYEQSSFTNGSFQHTLPSPGIDRTTEGILRINPIPNNTDPADDVFFYDPTPADDSEFDMAQKLFRDLGVTERTDRFNGTVPDVFEAGYRGAANSSAPAEAKNGTDLLTILFHEVGHGLGMTSALENLYDENGMDETDDGDFDFNPDFIAGNVMEAMVRPTKPEDVGDTSIIRDNRSHVFGSGSGNYAIMSRNSTRVRRRPSATDIYAMASISGWTNIDLPRQDFLGGTGNSWNENANWMGNKVPDGGEDVYVRHGDLVELTIANADMDTLLVSENSIVRTGSFLLVVQDTTTLEAGDQGDSSGAIWVDGGGKLRSDTVQLNDGGNLTLLTGTVEADHINIEAGASLSGSGTVLLTSLTPLLRNNGLINPTFGGTIIINANEPNAVDLDGDSENGVVNATQGDLVVNTGVTDPYGGVMTIGPNRTVTFDDTFALEFAGDIHLNGDPGSPATLQSNATLDITGDVTVEDQATINAANLIVRNFGNVFVSANSILQINAAIDAKAGADFVVQNGSVLRLNGSTTFETASLIGSGTAVQNGDALITQDFVVSVDVYDWDGDQGGNSNTVIDPGVTLTINSTKIEPGNIFDGHDGDITLNGGALTVNTSGPWGLDGVLRLNEQNAFDPVVGGQKIVLSGSIVALGHARIFSDISFQPGSFVGVNGATKVLTLEGDLTYGGGTLTGFGTVRQNGNAVVVGNTSIEVGQYDLDGQIGNSVTTINAGVTLTLSAGHIEVSATDQFDGTLNIAGRLDVDNVPDEWTNNGVINFSNGVIGGAKLINTGVINGNGTIEGNLINDLQLNPGNSSGQITVGSFEQGGTGILNMEIGGLVPVSEHDFVEIDTNAVFGGTLNLIFINGFAPNAGDTFDLITVGGELLGDFSATNIVNLAPGFESRTLFDGRTLQLIALTDGEFVPEPCAAWLMLMGIAQLAIKRRRRLLL